MGASALVSALNALPWEDEDDSSGDEDDILPLSAAAKRRGRPDSEQLVLPPLGAHEQSTEWVLHFKHFVPCRIRLRDFVDVERGPSSGTSQSLRFPFKANTIARTRQVTDKGGTILSIRTRDCSCARACARGNRAGLF